MKIWDPMTVTGRMPEFPRHWIGTSMPGDVGEGRGGNQPPPPTSQEPEVPTSLQGFLDTLSREELQELKFALTDSANMTTGAAIIVGGLTLVMASATMAFIVASGIGLIAVALSQLANEVDKRLARS